MPNDSRPPSGCLAFFLDLFSGGGAGGGGDASKDDGPWPFAKKDWLLSKAEFSFFRVLQQACGERWVVCPKVGMGDLLSIRKGTEKYQSWRNRINRKHIDFVLCDAETMKIVAAVELDDASHQGQKAQERDAVKDKACADAGLVLLRFPARRAYNIDEVRIQLETGLAQHAPRP
ncbi:DUF2726 domain-containing protein [Phycisphaeraceae bacterium D3-23]